MSNVKERILGAVTVMSEADAAQLWKIIIEDFSKWNNIETAAPDDIDLIMLDEIKKDPECNSFISSDELMKELGIE